MATRGKMTMRESIAVNCIILAAVVFFFECELVNIIKIVVFKFDSLMMDKLTLSYF